MPNLVGIGNSQVPTNAMLGGLAYQDPAHANLTNVEIENIAAIKAIISDSPTAGPARVFVYDTSYDSDGGAWRKRTQHTSWYNEQPGEYRGSRKEFPSIAVIVCTSNTVTIYDGDDPNLSMWMIFKSFSGGGGMENTYLMQYSAHNKVCALNGVMVIGQLSGSDNWGNPVVNFISEEVIRSDPNGSEGGVWGGGIAHRNTQAGYSMGGTRYDIANSRIRDISMKVLPDAVIDDRSGLPIPTIVYSHYNGISVVRATESFNDTSRNVYDITSSSSSHHLSVFNAITERGRLIFEQDGSNGQSIMHMDIPTGDTTSTHSSSNIADKTCLKPYYNSITYARWNEPIGTTQGCGNGVAMKDDNYALLSYGATGGGKATLIEPDFVTKEKTRVAYITKDYNSGWMVGGCRFAIGGDKVHELDGVDYALTATDGGTSRLTSETYSSGATSWQMVDNAGNNNGYVVVEFKGLTIGKRYKIQMTWDNNATLDSGYSHRVVHDNSGTGENPTIFDTWNKTNGSSETLTGYFTAQTENADDLVIYANAITLNVTNFSCRQTNDLGQYSGIQPNHIVNGSFDSSSGWNVNSWTISGGTATSGSGNDSVWRTVYGFTPGKTYAVTITVDTNNGNLYGYIPYTYGQFPISGTGTKHFFFIATSSNHPIGVTNLGTTGNVISEIRVRPVESSYAHTNSKGIYSFGNLTKESVESGADLTCYGGFSGSTDYLWQPYTSDLDFTTEMSIMCWVNGWTNGHSLLHRGPDTTRNSQTSFYLYMDSTHDIRFTLTSNGSSENNYEIELARNMTGWHHVCFTLKGGTVLGYLDGVLKRTGSFSGNIFSQATNANGLYVGRGPVGSTYNGKLSLLRISSSAPDAADVRSIYKDERSLFQPDAKCTVYGTSDDVNAIAYDRTTDLFHMGTSSGRSDFNRLTRINNTTNAVADHLSAAGGLIAEQ